MIDIAEICWLIDSHEGAPCGSYSVLDELCRRITVEDLLSLVIEEASNHPHEVSECARRSYRHALGFDKVMLMVGPGKSTLRVHVWRDTDARAHASEHIHNHRFEFASVVLRGDVVMETFEPHSEGVLMAAYEESIGAGDSGWMMRCRGTERLRKTMDLRLAPGTMYRMHAESLHRVVRSASSYTMTLFLEAVSRRVRTSTDVYTDLHAAVPSEFARVPMRPQEYLSALVEIRSLIASN
jgi:hypothetical protein